ncbi:hypothetical protein HK405_009036 [Cladochytrium tenue]|nr:hypothetical protein HK405_009036 [Cladochytrium tenue]
MLLSLPGLSTDDRTSSSSPDHRSVEDPLFVNSQPDLLACPSAISTFSSPSRPTAEDPENLSAPGINPLDFLLTELFDDNDCQHNCATSGRAPGSDLGAADAAEPGGGTSSPRWEDHLMLQQSGLYPTPLEQPLDSFFGSLNDPCPGIGFTDFPADAFLIDTLTSLLPSPTFTPVQSGKDSPSAASILSAVAFESVDYNLFDGSYSSSLPSLDDPGFSSDFPLFDEDMSFKSEVPSPSGCSPTVRPADADTDLLQSNSTSPTATAAAEPKITLSVSELAALIAAVKSGTVGGDVTARPRSPGKSPLMECDAQGARGSQPPPSPLDQDRARRRSSKLHHCPYPGCAKTFSRAFNLRTHELIHEPCRDRPFSCELCAKTFVRIHDLNRHMVIHDPVRGRPSSAPHNDLKVSHVSECFDG